MVKYTGQLNRYFKKDSIADIVSELPKPVMTLTDMFFPANRRVQKHSSLISLEDITAETGAVPLVRRGGHSVPVDPNSKTVQFIDLDGIKLIASSKPLPAFAMKRQSEQTVTTA